MSSETIPHAFIGVDPGVSGALAIYVPSTGYVDVCDMPATSTKDGNRKRSAVDEYAVGRWFGDKHHRFTTGEFDVRMAVIEDVHAMPKQGLSSTFTSGFSTGVVR